MAAWQRLGGISFAKHTVYGGDGLAWSLAADDLGEDSLSAAAAFGGPLALLPGGKCGRGAKGKQNTSSLVGDRNAGAIYDMCGRKLGNLPLEGGIPLVPGGFGWLDRVAGHGGELCVTVYVTGAVHAVTASGEEPLQAPVVRTNPFEDHGLSPRIMSLALANDEHDGYIVHACVFGDGIAAVLRSGKVVVAFAGEAGCLRTLNRGLPIGAGAALARLDVAAMTVVLDRTRRYRSHTARAKAVRVIVALAEGVVFTVSARSAVRSHVGEQHSQSTNPAAETKAGATSSSSSPSRAPSPAAAVERDYVLRASAAPNGKYVAFFSRNGWLTVMGADLGTTFLEFDTQAGVAPAQMCWCGSDAVVLQWKELGLLVVGPYGDWIKYTYNEPVVIIQEIDALRIISSTAVELLHRVAPSTEAIGRLGSFEPAAMLCDALDAMDNRDTAAADGMRALNEDNVLTKATLDCIEAAKADFDTAKQDRLLRAASLGKSFCDRDADRRSCASAFVLACNALRVLNIVRHESVALPLTIQQFAFMGAPRLALRLAARRMHLLALKITSYLGLDPAVKQAILVDWACAKLHADLPATVPEFHRTPTDPTDRKLVRSSSAASRANPKTLAASSAIAASLSRQIYTPPAQADALTRSPGPATGPPSRTHSPVPPSPSISHATDPSDAGSVAGDPISTNADGLGAFGRNPTSPARAKQERSLVDHLASKLAPVRGIPYARLSRIAATAGKLYASILLARQEPVSIRRTAQLLELEDYKEALTYAVSSYDPNLIQFAVLYMWPGPNSPLRRRLVSTKEASPENTKDAASRLAAQSEYFELVRRFPMARASLVHFCEAANERTMLKDFHRHTEHHSRMARVSVKEAFACPGLDARLEKLGVAAELYQQDRAERSADFLARATRDHMRLLRIQRELEANTGQSFFVDNSLADTVFNCFALQLDEKAREIKDEFGMSERAFAGIHVRAFAQLQEWSKLRALASTRRCAAPLLDFVTACVDAGNVDEARHYAHLIKDDGERLEAFIKTKSWENAIQVAVALKDTTTLQLVRNNCESDDLKLAILQHVRAINTGAV
ncbi:Vacuolar protein sorting-associated protein 16-like [Hondaea fermentalgiana]|uniref:Vacuolar protein sorting-associated protein 16-like n=1 Tax=Hondaea fermentalgiana TaxID=2315210 RepID=A0A2R5GU61_9STRA|nr:Vacuolar protein sorting-associated protein 16-like [Hondaea fermentalgiana]|eukprot:GBG34095.1 Vacuolar protein sorting-associated protein 16-like [Hondaea fermentalgiana]